MSGTKNYYIYMLFTALIVYMAYTFLWSRFGLGVTKIIQYVLLVLVLIGLAVYIVKPSYYKNSWSNWLILIWLTQAIGFVLGDTSATTSFKQCTFVLLSALPIISMQYNPKVIKRFFLILALVSIVMFFVETELQRLVNGYGGGYFVLAALPVLLYFFREKPLRIQVIITLICFFLILTSLKRGDILACALVMVTYFYIRLKGSPSDKYKIFIAIIVVAVIGYFTFTYLLTNNQYFSARFESTLEGNSSGRDLIYSSLWEYFLKAPLGVQIFGNGFNATFKIAGNAAHNDILEILTCEGIIGVLIYVGAFISLLKQTIKRQDTTEKAILASVIVIWGVKMAVSMFITSQPTVILLALTAYILNDRVNKQYE